MLSRQIGETITPRHAARTTHLRQEAVATRYANSILGIFQKLLKEAADKMNATCRGNKIRASTTHLKFSMRAEIDAEGKLRTIAQLMNGKDGENTHKR
jgi:hypothetical protein